MATVFKIEDGWFALVAADPTGGYTDVCDAAAADFTAFGDAACAGQVTSGALTATPNVTTETVPATFCDAEETIPSVGQTSYALELSFLQNPEVVDGISQFLFEHDTELFYFFFGLNGGTAADAPKAVGQIRLVAGTIGGDARTALTASVSLPLETKPEICFGPTAATGDPV